jgi:quercetin 2,3-dioxygenase
MTLRTVAQVVNAMPVMEGDGVEVRRAFPLPSLDMLDPFLLFDHFGPNDLEPGVAQGFPPHPHKGFETVTYMLDGEFEHRDSFGNHGLLKPGSVQWMTAGRGLVHSEMPGRTIVENGGRLQGFQLWVNLPKASKETAPKYQELQAEDIPHTSIDGVRAKVIAGEALGVRAAIGTHTPIEYVHFTLQPGSSHTQPVTASHNAFVYVLAGSGEISGSTLRAGQLAILSKDGDHVTLANTSSEPVDLLLIGGEPLNEPVARKGPFVMNTQAELYQAFLEFRDGRMGLL